MLSAPHIPTGASQRLSCALEDAQEAMIALNGWGGSRHGHYSTLRANYPREAQARSAIELDGATATSAVKRVYRALLAEIAAGADEDRLIADARVITVMVRDLPGARRVI